MSEKQYNENGEVAVKHTRLVPVRVQVNGRRYQFAIRANITMAWIQEEDVDQILSLLGGCCGNKTKKVYFLANESDVRRWTNNGGR